MTIGSPFPIVFDAHLPGELNPSALLADGRIVDVGPLGGGTIRLQFYSADGAAQGGVITVPPDAGFSGVAGSPEVAALAGGGFVVAAFDGTLQYTAVRTFDANGSPTSNWVEVDYPAPGGQNYAASIPYLLAAPGGGFYLGWDDNSQASVVTTIPEPPGGHTQVTSNLDAFGAEYSSTDVLQTSFHFQAQFGFAYPQIAGGSAVLTNGSVVTPYLNEPGWHNLPGGQFGQGYQVWASLNNTPFLVADFADAALPGEIGARQPDNDFYPMAVALAGGGFVVTYETFVHATGQNGTDEIFARFYNASGAAVSGEVPLVREATTQSLGTAYALTPLANGDFAMAYSSFTSPTSPAAGERGIAVAVIDASGNILRTLDVVDPSAGVFSIEGLTTAADGSVYVTYSGNQTPGTVMQRITNILSLTVAEALAAYNANANLTPVAVEDTAANVAGNLNALQVLTAHGKLSSIALTDPGDAVSITGAQAQADAATLTLITSVYNLIVTANGAPVTYALAGGVSGFSLSGEASAVINGNARFNTITLGSGNDTAQAGGGGSYIIGNGGNDVLIGGAGGGASGLGNTIYALGGNDYLQGGAGSPSDVLVATGAGNDTFYGGSGNNYIVGGTGQNTIVAGPNGLESLYSSGTADYMVGGGTSCVLSEQGSGNDTLFGGLNSNNYIVGSNGNCLLVGGSLSDYIFAGNGNTTMYGGNGTDYLYTGSGTDFIWTDNVGQPQSTDYIYETGASGTNTIADFTPGDVTNHDVLVMSGTNLHSFADVQAHATQGANSPYTVISASATDQIYLYNVQPFQLTANDFIFT